VTIISETQREKGAPGDLALRRAVVAWFLVAAVGQIAFVGMILVHYARNTVLGNFAGWNDKPLIKGYVAGDTVGNVMFAVHVLLAAVMTLGGLAQLVPAIRERVPTLHRWNGRLFFVLAILMAIGGLWLTGVRQTYLSPISGIAVSFNGLLILAFTTAAWRHAVRRRFAAHRRWALRAFMVVSGVWFLRIGIMAWVIATAGGLGMNRTMSGPADVVLQFGSFLIPLAALEAYFRAQKSPNAMSKRLVAVLVAVMTLVTAIGVFGTIGFMWLPYII
jgi:hypothetical protein